MLPLLPRLVLLPLLLGSTSLWVGCWNTDEEGQSGPGSSGQAVETGIARANDSDDREVRWVGFGGGESTWFQASGSLPAEWSMDSNMIWAQALPGRGASSPVVLNDRLYLTAFSGFGVDATDPGDFHDLRHHLLCFDANTGEPMWHREIAGTDLRQKMNPELARHGFASSTPAIDGDRVYAWFGVSGLFAFDRDGELLWQRNLGLETNYFGSSASLVLHKDLVIVNASIESSSIYGVDRETGAVRWTIPDVDESWSLPVIGNATDGRTEMVISSKNVLAGYDPETGHQLWHCRGIQDYVVSVPVIVNAVCYLTGGKEKQMMAVRLGGDGDVESTHKVWETKRIGANVSSPVIRDNLMFVFHDSGILQVINLQNGELITRQRTATRTQPFATPLLVRDRLYMPFQDAGVGIYTATEDPQEVAVVAAPQGESLIASLAAGNNRFWFRSDAALYCVGSPGQSSQLKEWQVPADTAEIQARKIYNVESEKSWSRRYLLFLTDDMDQIQKYLLMPYQSVITDAQTSEARKILEENAAAYEELFQRFKTIESDRLAAPASEDAAFDERYQQLEADVNQLNNDVRILVKKLFSEAQLEQHYADAKAGKSHIKPDEQ